MLLLIVIASALAAPKKHSSDAASRIRRAARNRAATDVGVDPLPLQGKLAVVTGGGRGIGAAVAKALAQRGCRVLSTCSIVSQCLSMPGSVSSHRIRFSCSVVSFSVGAAPSPPSRHAPAADQGGESWQVQELQFSIMTLRLDSVMAMSDYNDK